ncbi:protein kinase domain-containing protein [Nocardia vermiculata]|uniref:protein kinase domain-containing protein n=1 Tax=Nocardia vermiculata TaxID=257274 RepID=UPI00082F26E6
MEVPRSRAGTKFGPYEVRSLLGRGGTGEVYEAFDTGKDRVVALKVLPEELAQDPGYQRRFRRESQAAAGLDEPHIIPIHNWGTIDGVLYIEMRLVRGESLRTLLRRQGQLDPERAVAIVEQVAAALDAAHAAGLVHRDVKPANVLVTPADFAYLADFGIARSESDNAATTTAGYAAGSYTYMAPERFDSGPVNARADIYSLACVLYECLTGRPPFPAESISVLIRGHLSTPPPFASAVRSDVPAAIDEVIVRALAKAPADRYHTAGQFLAAARRALGHGGRAPEPVGEANTSTIFGAELLSGDRPADTGSMQAVPAAAREEDLLRAAEPTTFQPFGPEGPTIAARFQPRGYAPAASGSADEAAPADATPTGPEAEPPTQAEAPEGPAQPSPPAATSRGYETTGTLRIITPQSGDERDTSGDLPVIRPNDPTLVRPGEFNYTPLPGEGTPPAPAAPSLPLRTPHPAVSTPPPAVSRPHRTDDERGTTAEHPSAAQPPAAAAPAAGGAAAGGAAAVGGTAAVAGAAAVAGTASTADASSGAGAAEQPARADSDPRTQYLDPSQFHTTPATDASARTESVEAAEPAAAAMRPDDEDSDYRQADPADANDAPTQLLDPIRIDDESGAAAEGATEFLDISQFSHATGEHAPAGAASATELLDISEFGTGSGVRGFDDEDYRDDEDDSDYRGAGEYSDQDYADEDFADEDYHDDRYGDDPDDDSVRDEGFAFSSTERGRTKTKTAKRQRSVAVPIVLGALGAAILAGIVAVAWQLLGSSDSDTSDSIASPAQPAVTAQQPNAGAAAPTTSTAPTGSTTSTTSATSTTSTTAALPVGASPCSQSSGVEDSFGKTATGSSVTSCGFAEAVREAYAQAAESSGATNAASPQATTSIVAVSPVTGQSYPMTCTSDNRVVTCSGGDNAVVYVY